MSISRKCDETDIPKILTGCEHGLVKPYLQHND